MAGRGRVVGLQTHDGGAAVQRARGVGVAGAHAAGVRDDVARVARALICRSIGRSTVSNYPILGIARSLHVVGLVSIRCQDLRAQGLLDIGKACSIFGNLKFNLDK